MTKLVFVFLLIAGCATSHKINRVSLGMTKAQVIQAMGDPVSTSASDGIEGLRYHLYDNQQAVFQKSPTEYWIYFNGGRVVKYGKAGDFDMGAPETRKIIIQRETSGQ
jgi:outer membrane protein assembly factor BamE (lipoprotein component of BamABCDE complex)